MYVPEKILTNQELETELGESIDDFVSNNIGIKTRRIAKEEETTASMSIEAAKMALKEANVSPEEIDLII